MPKWFEFKAAKDDAVDLYIYDEIGVWGVTATDFMNELKAIKAGTINLRLNTPGGSVFDGNAIFNALDRHPAKVITHIDGLAASMGSIIALAGDEIHMAANALYMIHNPWTYTMGDANELRKTADVIDKLTDGLVQAYMNKTGMAEDDIRSAMNDETWYTASEALEAGFIDFVSEDQAIAAKADDWAGKFKNMPQDPATSAVDPENIDQDEKEVAQRAEAATKQLAKYRQQLNEWDL